ncbi:hypothetical protein FA10DRAFT_255311 [Acaromyces ingoldii]|uniref:BRCT domain-containing protein n=1 Tax=Acaromyces ingoldii TaxID=215250 RepID=A0A316YDQ4_9BASI|nr:hypothetical protein FA10DRAFT_255311 [Acaromyces ingoldii]PWN87730.1 hypothetical protein FA10DRAFT_255311 [Acaromyces ingoldii]
MPSTHYVNQVAPLNRHSPRTAVEMASGQDESFTFTVGKLDAGMAILIGDRASLIEFPSLLLPQDATSGSVVRISVSRNQKEEERKRREFDDLQEDVLETFGTRAPVAPALRLRAVTQTSITLEWDRLDLATSKLLSLDIYRNSERLAPIPNPLNNTSTKLSGLEVNKPYQFHLILKTTAGTFTSNVVRTKTHDMSDTSGISVCFGYVAGGAAPSEHDGELSELEARARETLEAMGARFSDRIQIDTTHFVCTHPRNRTDSPGEAQGNERTREMRGAMFNKAMQLSIPVVLPHWIFACAEQKRMVPISAFYIDKEPPNATAVRASLSKGKGVSANNDEAAAAAAAAAESSARAQQSLPPTPAHEQPTPTSATADIPAPAAAEPGPEARHIEEESGAAGDTAAIATEEEPDSSVVVAAAEEKGEGQESSAAVPSSSATALKDDEETMDDVSLGGGASEVNLASGAGVPPSLTDAASADAPADEEVDLS